MIKGGHPTVIRGHLVGAHPEHAAENTGQTNVKTACLTGCGSDPRDRRLRAGLACVPTSKRIVTPQHGQQPRTAEPDLIPGVGVDELLNITETQGEPRVVHGGRQQIPDPDIARSQPLRPRHPLRSGQGAVAGQQHNIIHSDFPHPRRAAHDHRPHPTGIGSGRTRKAMQDETLALRLDAEVLANTARIISLGDRGGAGFLHSRGARGVQRGRFGPLGRPRGLRCFRGFRGGGPGHSPSQLRGLRLSGRRHAPARPWQRPGCLGISPAPIRGRWLRGRCSRAGRSRIGRCRRYRWCRYR